jgi:hypothetical protein
MRADLTTDNVRMDNWCLTEDQPVGWLRNFLLAKYPNASAVERAFIAGGGSIVVRAVRGTEPVAVAFGVDDVGRPTLHFVGQKPDSTVEIRLLLEHLPPDVLGQYAVREAA